jgi:hypothetical protein
VGSLDHLSEPSAALKVIFLDFASEQVPLICGSSPERFHFSEAKFAFSLSHLDPWARVFETLGETFVCRFIMILARAFEI